MLKVTQKELTCCLFSLSFSDAQREKFNQLYKISDSTDFEDTVIRLVDLVQNCLFIFGLFKLEDVDGLLCNATEGGLEEFYHTFLITKFQVTKDMDLPPFFFSCFKKSKQACGHIQRRTIQFVLPLPRNRPLAKMSWTQTCSQECLVKSPTFEENYNI